VQLTREEEERVREAPSAPPALGPADPRLDRLRELQRSAGNSATTGLLQRDGVQFTLPPASAPPLGSGAAAPNLSISPDFVAKQDEEIKKKITEYLEREKPVVIGHVSTGWSIAELVDLVRTKVPEATRLGPETVAQMLRRFAAPQTIAEHRKPGDVKGQESELVATVKNAFSKIPTKVELKRSGAFVRLSISGLEAGYEQDENNKVVVGSTGSDAAVNISVKHVHFAAKLEPKQEGTKWEVGLTFPGEDLIPMMGSLGGLFGSANRGLGSAASDLRAGKVNTGSLKEKFEPVKEAAGAVSAIAEHSAVSFGIKIEGEGPDVKAMATLTVTF
jgi:hypothetical protein